MLNRSLINILELAYAPITAYEFSIVKNDKDIEKALENASIYIIAQRPVITFEKVIINNHNYSLNFEIHQKNNPNVLSVELPLIQKILNCSKNETIGIAFNFFEKKGFNKFPINNVHGFSLIKAKNKELLIWFSPEKLLQNWWKNNIDCSINGNYKSFLHYKVLYVGKATKQGILKRLTGHSTFQDILSLEKPVTELQIPANEIVILPFKFKENLHIEVFNKNGNIQDMISSIKGERIPQQEKIFLDAEKALINAMKPTYNKELFSNYPISKDGLYKDEFKYISYTFFDPITLKYEFGKINNNDEIVILNNNKLRLVKR